MIAERPFTIGDIRPVETGSNFAPRNLDSGDIVPRERVKITGFEVVGAAIFAIGLYKVATADSLGDLVIGGILMYAGHKIFTHKSQRAESSLKAA